MDVKKEILTEMFENNVRAEQVIHIGSQMVDESLPSSVKDAFDSDWDEVWGALNVPEPDVEYDLSEIAWDMRVKYKKQGYLVRFATPIPKRFDDDFTGWSHSWGMFTMKWIYGETMQECCEKAIVWQENYINECIKREKIKREEEK